MSSTPTNLYLFGAFGLGLPMEAKFSDDDDYMISMDASSVYRKVDDELHRTEENDELPPPGQPSPPKKRFKVCSEADSEALFEARQAPSTKRSTTWAMKIFQGKNQYIILDSSIYVCRVNTQVNIKTQVINRNMMNCVEV